MSNEAELNKDSTGRPQGFCVRPFDSFSFGGHESLGVLSDLIGRNHRLTHFMPPNKGHKYISQSNPTHASVRPVLEKMKEPSVLALQGCELLFLQAARFPFEKFESLTTLEISGITQLTALPDAISGMTQLQNLTLSHLPIKQLPADDFLLKPTNLRSLVVRGCSEFHSLPSFPRMPALGCLELSYLPLLETFPREEEFYNNISELRWLILRGCSKLRSLSLPDGSLLKLEVLDLSHCTTLDYMGDILYKHPSLQMLDVSHTDIYMLKFINHPPSHLTHLFVRDTSMFELSYITCYLPFLKVLDLSGVPYLEKVGNLRESLDLEALDLSRSGIESIEFISGLIHLRQLILMDCIRLVNLPMMKNLTKLEVLDLSGCENLADLPEDLGCLGNLKELNLSGCGALEELREGVFDNMVCLERLDLSKTNVKHLPSLANLTNLQTLNLSQTSVEKAPDLSNHLKLKEFVPPMGFVGVQSSGMGHVAVEERLASNRNDFHIVSTFKGDSGFDRFVYEFKSFDDLISKVEMNIKATNTPSVNLAFKRKFGNMRADLKYILKQIDALESSSSCSTVEELLIDLLDAAKLSADKFPLHSTELYALLRVIAKLKLLVPPPKKVDEKKKKKKKSQFATIKDEEDVVMKIEDMNAGTVENLRNCYESLTDIQKNCLLYFAVFPSRGVDSIEVKQSVLFNLWYGEALVDEAITYANNSIANESLNQLDPTSLNPNPDVCTSGATGSARKGADQTSCQVSTAKAEKNVNTIEDTVRQIFGALEEEQFIEPRMERGTWIMYPDEYTFIRSKAKDARFFNFDEHNGKLTPHITATKRACLLKSQDGCSSSCKLWLNYTDSSLKLERFRSIHTLLYVNEPILDIRTEWFSHIENLSVLHLAGFLFENEEQFDVMDIQFLEELKNMKQLRLLSMQGFSVIQKLPDSICKVSGLRMLNLADCSNLEELPAGIGSLANLTYIDLTNCHLLSMLPKGLSLLSKVEVLKGFAITFEAGGRQHTNACTLRELLTLKKLRKLTLVVNRDQFPNSEDLMAFKGMKNLCNMKITWKRSYDEDQEPHDGVRPEALWRSKWKQLKCWQQQPQMSQSDSEEESLRSNHFNNLKKLVLSCFPLEIAPNWLHPGEFLNLEKLYFVGGNLKAIPRDRTQGAWNVQILKFKYMRYLKENWRELHDLFPNVKRPWIHECPNIEIHYSDYRSD